PTGGSSDDSFGPSEILAFPDPWVRCRSAARDASRSGPGGRGGRYPVVTALYARRYAVLVRHPDPRGPRSRAPLTFAGHRRLLYPPGDPGCDGHHVFLRYHPL